MHPAQGTINLEGQEGRRDGRHGLYSVPENNCWIPACHEHRRTQRLSRHARRDVKRPVWPEDNERDQQAKPHNHANPVPHANPPATAATTLTSKK
jgi:hypothetical protein